MDHSPRFLALVDDARSRITEWTVAETRAARERGESFHLVDVREESEFAASRIPGATHLGKGVIERDAERELPDPDARIVLYCGGGYRSALAADALQRMGYRDVISMDGGIRAWREAGLPLEDAPLGPLPLLVEPGELPGDRLGLGSGRVGQQPHRVAGVPHAPARVEPRGETGGD